MDSYVPRYHRVYLVDDHDIVRRGLRDLLVNANDIDVVGDSHSVREAVPDILRLEVDVMLLDLNLQDGTGIDVCRAVRAVKPSVTALLLTAAGDDEALAATVLAGAAGYLVKLSRNTDIVGAIRRLRAGTTLLDPDSVARAEQRLGWVIDSLTPVATDGERQLLERVITGETNSQIAEGLDREGAGAEVERLVSRLTHGLLGHRGLGSDRGTGRHRRPE